MTDINPPNSKIIKTLFKIPQILALLQVKNITNYNGVILDFILIQEDYIDVKKTDYLLVPPDKYHPLLLLEINTRAQWKYNF